MNTEELFDRIIATTIEDFSKDRQLVVNRKVFEEMKQPLFEIKWEEETITIKIVN